MLSIKSNNISIFFYSSSFIFVSLLLLLKLSPELFLIFNFFPLFLVGLSTSILMTFYSHFFSLMSLLLFFKFNLVTQNYSNTPLLIFNLLFIFFISFSFSSFLKYKKNKFLFTIADSLSYVVVIITVCLVIFLKSYFFELNFSSTINEIKGLYLDQIKENKNVIETQITGFLNLLINILPSLNSTFYLLLSILNLLIAQKFLKKLNIHTKREIHFKEFEISNWFFFTSIFSLVTAYFTHAESQIIALNIFIILSFIIILKGYLIFMNYLKKKDISNGIKFLLLFLLFIFFSYLLLIFFFILGTNYQIKKNFLK